MSAWRSGKSPLNLYRDDLREALGRGGKTLAAMRRALNEHGAGVLDIPDEAVKVWSDLHLGHENIIRFQNRPFHNDHEMDAALWANWQLGVGTNDTLVCVGDFAMGAARTRATWDLVRAAPGRPKILVIGNHELVKRGQRAVRGFARYKALLVSPGDPPLIWTYAPLPNVPAGRWEPSPAPAPSRIDRSVRRDSRQRLGRTDRVSSRFRWLRSGLLARALIDGRRPLPTTTLQRIATVVPLTRETGGCLTRNAPLLTAPRPSASSGIRSCVRTSTAFALRSARIRAFTAMAGRPDSSIAARLSGSTLPCPDGSMNWKPRSRRSAGSPRGPRTADCSRKARAWRRPPSGPMSIWIWPDMRRPALGASLPGSRKSSTPTRPWRSSTIIWGRNTSATAGPFRGLAAAAKSLGESARATHWRRSTISFAALDQRCWPLQPARWA